VTLLLLVNLGLAGSNVTGPAFNPAWAVNANKHIGPTITQAVPK
jgi:hypothetical protein